MKFKYIFILMLLLPTFVLAKINEEEIVTQTTKYYKTININSNETQVYSINDLNSYTIEITQEEYDSFKADQSLNATIETTYKKMTTTISKVNSYYRYKVNLEWKNIPTIRSFDTIAIGFPASVKTKATPIFNEKYCVTNSECYTTTSYLHLYNDKNGIGVTFQVPTGNLVTMNQILYVDMQKNTTSTIIAQYAYGDYAHAIKTISLSKAKNYIVNTNGIEYNSSNISYYDEINYAKATWNGSW